MRSVVLLTMVCAVALGAEAQTKPLPTIPPPVSILGCQWIRAARSAGSSGDQEQKAKDAAINQQIALANREAEGSGQGSPEAQALGERKEHQLALIPLPTGVVKGYLYKVQVRNVGDQTIKRLQWSYVFTEAAGQKAIFRHQFESHTSIRPGQEKKLSAFTRGSPPAVVDVKELSKNPNQPWGESVVIDRVEFADGTIWKAVAKEEVLKPVSPVH